jgi:uncharacterized protein YbjT (DUF2867 family)
MQSVFITGGTGYTGRRLIARLLQQGYAVTALVRKQSLDKLPAGCQPLLADPFDAGSFAHSIAPNSIFIQLLGVAHPGPRKKELFYSVDLASVKASVAAAKDADVTHFIYVSVAQYPTKIMESYQQVRAQGEDMVLSAGLKATIIRPWYVIGPGHYWPLLLQPLFWLLQYIPATAEKAKALALVSLHKMLLALESAVKQLPENQCRIIEIEEIRRLKE